MFCRHFYETADQNPEFSGHEGRHFRHGVPLPLKAAGLVGATLLCPALGLAALAAMVACNLRRGGPGACRKGRDRFERFRARYGMTGNSAFDEHRRATMDKLEEEARAFEDFERQQREARDRADFERFKNERAAKSDKPSEPPVTE